MFFFCCVFFFFFPQTKPVLPQREQDKFSLDICLLLSQSSFQVWDGIMTVQFVAHFSLSFLWYFQKNVTQPDGPPSPATPKVSITFKEKKTP